MIIKGLNFTCGYMTVGMISLLIMIFTSIVGFFVGPSFIGNKIKSMNLKPGSVKRNVWEKTPYPMTFKIYIFNITNPIEFTQGEKAHVKEVGPYVFDEWKSKNILDDDEKEDTVTYELINKFYFRPDLSNNLTGDEIVVVPHMLLMGGLIATQRDKAAFLGLAVTALTQIFQPEQTPLLTVKAMDLLFNGIGIDCDREEAEASFMCPVIAEKKGIVHVNDTYYLVSLFGGKNGTSLGKFKVSRGGKNIMDIGKVLTFEDKNVTSFDGECSKISGTEGSSFPPFHKKPDSYFSYSSALCRTLEFKYQKDSSYNGVPTGVYRVHYGNDKNDPDKICFCRKKDPEKCAKKGTADTYPCGGAPMILSKPHFLDADESLLENVVGLKPDRNRHDSAFNFELHTSATISVRNRNQFSMDVERVEKFDLMANLTSAVVPFFWIEESIDLPEKATSPIKKLHLLMNMMTVMKVAGIIIGIFGILYSGYKKYEEGVAVKNNEVQAVAGR